MADPYFLNAALSGLSNSLGTLRDTQLKKQQQEEMQDRAVFETLLKSGNPEMQRLGLAGLMEKRGKGWFGKLRESKVMPEVDEVLNRVNTKSSPPPAIPDQAAQPATSPTEGGGMTLTPGISAPPSPPEAMLSASTSEEPIEDIQARLQQQPPAAPAPPPASADFQSRYTSGKERLQGDFYKTNPLGNFSMTPVQERLLTAESLGLPPDRIRELVEQETFPVSTRLEGASDLEGMKQKNRVALQQSKRGIELDEATAQRLGVEAGLIDAELYKQLEANYRSLKGIEGRRANAQLVASHTNLRYFPNAEGGMTAVNPRTNEIVGEPVGEGGTTFNRKPPAQAENKAHQARVIINRGDELIKQIKDNPNMGPILGRIAKGEIDLGTVSPEIRAVYTALESFADLQPALHGSRGIAYAQRFSHAIGGLETNPAAVIASIIELQKTAQDFQDEVTPPPRKANGRTVGTPPPAKPAAAGASDPLGILN